jgi:CP family cyanate transporter-like MFS transporter
MVMISRSGASTAETTALSTLAQSSGYLLATAGPFGMGLLHSATGGWILPLALLLALSLAQIAVAHLITGSAMTRSVAGTTVRTAAPGAGTSGAAERK